MRPADDVPLVEAHRGHSGALQSFVCATPSRPQYRGGRGTFHPCPWELEVQSHLRSLRVPLPDSEALIVGIDDGAVAAACHFGYDSDGENVIVFAIGVAPTHQRRGLGTRLIEYVLRSVESDDLDVLARIDERNAPSIRLFSAAGFVDTGIRTSTLSVWARPSAAGPG